MIVIDGKEVFTTLEELVNPKHNALLLVDLQNDYVKTGGYRAKEGQDSPPPSIVTRVRTVLESARRCGIFVVHIQMTQYANSLAESPASLHTQMLRIRRSDNEPFQRPSARCIENTWGWQIADELVPLPGETICRKHRGSAFVGTDLDLILGSNGIKSVTITGVVTQGCVMATAKHALLLDYYPIVLQDCVASPKKEYHDAALMLMASSIFVVNSAEVIKLWSFPSQDSKR